MSFEDNNHQSAEPASAPASTKIRSRAAMRMKRYRARRRDGMRCVTLDLRETEIDRLIELGHLRRDDREDRNQLLLALYRFLDESALAGCANG